MPEVNGEETYRRMRAIDASVAVLLMSGYTEQEASTHLDGQGTSGFIPKPFRLDELREALRRVLSTPRIDTGENGWRRPTAEAPVTSLLSAT